jgi:hypothetical protein
MLISNHWGWHMGDKSPKSKEKSKKQGQASKDKKHATHDALMAAKRKAGEK